MFREVSMAEVREVLRLRQQGRSLHAIERLLSVDRKTIRRYLEFAVAAGFDPKGAVVSEEAVSAVLGRARPGRPAWHGASWAELERHHVFLKARLDAGLTLTKIHTLLGRQGIVVPYRTLQRYCSAELDWGGHRDTVPVADGEPGHELQADFGRLGKVGRAGGPRRLVKGLALTPCVSRYTFCWPTYGETLPEVIEGFEEAWDFYGGVFRVVIVDYVARNIIDVLCPAALCGRRPA